MILYLNRTSHGGQGTRELDERAVTRGLDQSPVVAGEARLDYFALQPLELGIGGFLSALHQRGVTDHVSSQDRRQSPLNPLLRHSALPNDPTNPRRWDKGNPSTLSDVCERKSQEPDCLSSGILPGPWHGGASTRELRVGLVSSYGRTPARCPGWGHFRKLNA